MHRRAFLTAALAAPAAALPGLAVGQGFLLGYVPPGDLFVPRVLSGSLYIMQASSLLLGRSGHPQIRDYAEAAGATHSRLADGLRAMPEAAWRAPTPLNREHEWLLAELTRQQSPEMFHRFYVEHMASVHEDLVDAYTAFAFGGDREHVRSFAMESLPVLQVGARRARALQAGA